MTLTEIYAFHGLKATAAPTGTNVGGTDVIGEVLRRTEFSDADIAYSVLVGDGGGSTGTLTLSTGILTGSAATLTDGDGKDFEGVTLPTLATLYAIQFAGITGTTAIACSNASMPDVSIALNANVLWTLPAGLAIGAGTVVITPSDSTVEITVIGKA